MAIYTKFCTYENIPLYGTLCIIAHVGGCTVYVHKIAREANGLQYREFHLREIS